ncbi:MAG: TlyA family RNA methyltransferase [Oscillospiraceae bacterium]|nr:TlyA family RNA methyltransferase [Oscillospiraceae bacterium]
MRLDVYLSQNGIKSREAAKSIIKKGVVINGRTVTKPSFDVTGDEDIVYENDMKYVGRGGLKLEHAIREFELDLTGYVCLDIGASTGGFTDCMLQSGASYVYAVDVGHGQLAQKLVCDSRVRNMEGMNIRSVTRSDFDRDIDFIGTDVSFISLKLVLPVIYELLSGKNAVVLIKPQFECGRAALGKGGIVKSDKVTESVREDLRAFAEATGFAVEGIIPSPITGGDGNREFLMLLKK